MIKKNKLFEYCELTFCFPKRLNLFLCWKLKKIEKPSKKKIIVKTYCSKSFVNKDTLSSIICPFDPAGEGFAVALDNLFRLSLLPFENIWKWLD